MERQTKLGQPVLEVNQHHPRIRRFLNAHYEVVSVALAQKEGPERGLDEIRSITERDRLASYPFYSAALGEIELRRGRPETAREHFRAALALARNLMERRFLGRRVTACDAGDPKRALY